MRKLIFLVFLVACCSSPVKHKIIKFSIPSSPIKEKSATIETISDDLKKERIVIKRMEQRFTETQEKIKSEITATKRQSIVALILLVLNLLKDNLLKFVFQKVFDWLSALRKKSGNEQKA